MDNREKVVTGTRSLPIGVYEKKEEGPKCAVGGMKKVKSDSKSLTTTKESYSRENEKLP